MKFEQLCRYLATKGGGYTLWIGAGAARAVTRGATPTWGPLVDGFLDSYKDRLAKLPPTWSVLDMPSRLDFISSRIGHAEFRRYLRLRIVDAITADALDPDVIVSQAIVGARAGAIVSFNIEMITATIFAAGRGGSFVARTYREPRRFINPFVNSEPGLVTGSVYFPHGLLDTDGNCVMTKSEYARYKMSMGVRTAISLCLGGDLLILGMSLGDAYLRRAILKQRRWIRNIYWITSGSTDFSEWARTAGVTCVEASYSALWDGIARAHLEADAEAHGHGDDAKLVGMAKFWREHLPGHMTRLIDKIRSMQELLNGWAERIKPDHGAEFLEEFACYCMDLGLDVPARVRNDLRCRL